MRFTDIQKLAYKLGGQGAPFSRGWWCAGLVGPHGILTTFCTNKNNRWVRNDKPHNGKPWASSHLS